MRSLRDFRQSSLPGDGFPLLGRMWGDTSRRVRLPSCSFLATVLPLEHGKCPTLRCEDFHQSVESFRLGRRSRVIVEGCGASPTAASSVLEVNHRCRALVAVHLLIPRDTKFAEPIYVVCCFPGEMAGGIFLLCAAGRDDTRARHLQRDSFTDGNC